MEPERTLVISYKAYNAPIDIYAEPAGAFEICLRAENAPIYIYGALVDPCELL